MTASVSGDINNYFSGDSAYFNAVEHPVKKGGMVGTIGEEQTREMLDGFGSVDITREGALDLAAQLGFIDEEEAEEAAENTEVEGGNQEEEQAESGDFSEWVEQQLRAENPDEGDNFGLNLASIRADVTPKNEEGAWGMFLGAFSMSISGRIDQFDDQQRFSVMPSLVMTAVGLSDKGGDRISFEMQEGNPLEIVAKKDSNDFITGTIKGELQTKGPYTLEGVTDKPRKLKITIDANFAARRGSLSCMR